MSRFSSQLVRKRRAVCVFLELLQPASWCWVYWRWISPLHLSQTPHALVSGEWGSVAIWRAESAVIWRDYNSAVNPVFDRNPHPCLKSIHPIWLWRFYSVVSAVVCHPGADAGAHVETQDLQPQPSGLSQDMPVPKMAEDGRPTR